MHERDELIAVVAVEPVYRADPYEPVPVLQQARYGIARQAELHAEALEGEAARRLCAQRQRAKQAQQVERPYEAAATGCGTGRGMTMHKTHRFVAAKREGMRAGAWGPGGWRKAGEASPVVLPSE